MPQSAQRNLHQHDHGSYSKSFTGNGFLRQVRLTKHGRSVSVNNIVGIQATNGEGLAFSEADIPLDHGCGNRTLRAPLGREVSLWKWVDSTRHLVAVAEEFFGGGEQTTVKSILATVVVEACDNPGRLSKGVYYGHSLFLSLRAHPRSSPLWPRDRVVFKRSCMETCLSASALARSTTFAPTKVTSTFDIEGLKVGSWRSRSELERICSPLREWGIEFNRMSVRLRFANDRFDAVQTRKEH